MTSSITSYKSDFQQIKTDKSIPSDFSSLMFYGTLASYNPKESETKQTFSITPSIDTKKENEDNLPAEKIYETNITKGAETLFGIQINNETDYDLSNAFSYTPPHKSSEPTVLILHTHTSEAYRPTKEHMYSPTDIDRTEDTSFNVARVGEELAASLNKKGIVTLHDSTICDYPSYNGSYEKMQNLAKWYLEKYPSIQIIIDLHRDAMIKNDGTKISTVANIDGEKYAQIMLVTGTDFNGLYHPSWKSNFSFAVKLQQILDSKFKGLARPLNVRCERFNGHLCEKEILIEIGTTGNTLSEALLSADAVADAIKCIIQDN